MLVVLGARQCPAAWSANKPALWYRRCRNASPRAVFSGTEKEELLHVMAAKALQRAAFPARWERRR